MSNQTHRGHEVGILIVFMIIGDGMGPLPEGVSHIVRMTLVAPKFRDLDLTRESSLFFCLPPEVRVSLESLPLQLPQFPLLPHLL